MTRSASPVIRSLRLYHGDKARGAKMDALYRRFIKPGDLVFDVGAHVGDRVASFRRLGARVIAIEPQPGPARALAIIHGRDPDVVLVRAAVSDRAGDLTLRLNTSNPTVSTASPEFVAAAQGARGWEGQNWDAEMRVAATTLDALVRQCGAPAFIKIDVEGYEDRVLAGLSASAPALSFEFTTIARAVALRSLEALAGLDRRYRFNLSLGESLDWALPEWLGRGEMARFLDGLPHEANSGDVYAELR